MRWRSQNFKIEIVQDKATMEMSCQSWTAHLWLLWSRNIVYFCFRHCCLDFCFRSWNHICCDKYFKYSMEEQRHSLWTKQTVSVIDIAYITARKEVLLPKEWSRTRYNSNNNIDFQYTNLKNSQRCKSWHLHFFLCDKLFLNTLY